MSVAHKFGEKARTGDVISGESVDFASLLLSAPVLHGLQNAGFERPSPIQLKAIPLGRCGLDLIVQAKSGTGKTCVFSVIALESIQVNAASTQVLVLAPTREIAVQIWEVIGSLGSAMQGLRCHTFIGGLPLHEDKKKLQLCHIAIGTPGRIQNLLETGCLKTESIRMFILDEADKLLEESFQQQINWIYSALPDNKQMLALSATYPEYLAQHLTVYMRNPTFIRLNISDPTLLGIKQYFTSVTSHPLPHKVFEAKTAVVVHLLSSVSFHQCLIFSNMQSRAQNLESELTSRGWPTTCIAGRLEQKERMAAMSKLKSYQCRVLISTDLTSRGIDADKVNLVINLDVPKDHETYLHRIGRAGRFGSYGAAVTIVSEGQELLDMRNIEGKISTQIPSLPDPIPSDLVKRQLQVSLDDVVSTEQIITRDQLSSLGQTDKVSAPAMVTKDCAAFAPSLLAADTSLGSVLMGTVRKSRQESVCTGWGSADHAEEYAKAGGTDTGKNPGTLRTEENTSESAKDDGRVTGTGKEQEQPKGDRNSDAFRAGVGPDPLSLDQKNSMQNMNGAVYKTPPASGAVTQLESVIHTVDNSVEADDKRGYCSTAHKLSTQYGEEPGIGINTDKKKGHLKINSVEQRVSYTCVKEAIMDSRDSIKEEYGTVEFTGETETNCAQDSKHEKLAGLYCETGRKNMQSSQENHKVKVFSVSDGSSLCSGISVKDTNDVHSLQENGDQYVVQSDPVAEPACVLFEGQTVLSADVAVSGTSGPEKGRQNGQQVQSSSHSEMHHIKLSDKKPVKKSSGDMWTQMLADEGFQPDKLDLSPQNYPQFKDKMNNRHDLQKLKQPFTHTGKGKNKELSWEDELALYVSHRQQALCGHAGDDEIHSKEKDTGIRPKARARRRLGNEDRKRGKAVADRSPCKNSTSAGVGEMLSVASSHAVSTFSDRNTSITPSQFHPQELNQKKKPEGKTSDCLAETERNLQQEQIQEGETSVTVGPKQQPATVCPVTSRNIVHECAKGVNGEKSQSPTDDRLDVGHKSKTSSQAAKFVTNSVLGCHRNLNMSGGVGFSTDNGQQNDVKDGFPNYLKSGGKTQTDSTAIPPSADALRGLLPGISGCLKQTGSRMPVSFSAILQDYQQFSKRSSQSSAVSTHPLTASEYVKKTFRVSRGTTQSQQELRQVADALDLYHKHLKLLVRDRIATVQSSVQDESHAESRQQVNQDVQTKCTHLLEISSSVEQPTCIKKDSPTEHPSFGKKCSDVMKSKRGKTEIPDVDVVLSGKTSPGPGDRTSSTSAIVNKAEMEERDTAMFKKSVRTKAMLQNEAGGACVQKGELSLETNMEKEVANMHDRQLKEGKSETLDLPALKPTSSTEQRCRSGRGQRLQQGDHTAKISDVRVVADLLPAQGVTADGLDDISDTTSSSSFSESESEDRSAGSNSRRENLVFFKNYYADESASNVWRKKIIKSKDVNERRNVTKDKASVMRGSVSAINDHTAAYRKVRKERGRKAVTGLKGKRNTVEGSSVPCEWDAWYQWYRAAQGYNASQIADEQTYSAHNFARRSWVPSSYIFPWAPSIYTHPCTYPKAPSSYNQSAQCQYPFSNVYGFYHPAQTGHGYPWQAHQQCWQQQPSQTYLFSSRDHALYSSRFEEIAKCQAARAASVQDYVHSMAKFYKEWISSSKN